MISRSAFFSLVVAVPALASFALPLAAHATGIPFFGAIVPSSAQTCAAGFGQLAQVANNLIAFLLTLLILFVAPFMIAWAGFLYVVSPANPSMRSKASSILKNTAIGIAVALAAWLVIDLLLTTLTYQRNSATDYTVTNKTTGGVQSFTSALFSTDSTCLIDTSKLSNSNLTQAVGQTIDTSLSTGGATGSSGTVSLTIDQACAGNGGVYEDADGKVSTDSSGKVECKDGTFASTKVDTGSALTAAQACAGNGGVDNNSEANMGGSAYVCLDGTTVCATAGATTDNDCQKRTADTTLEKGSGGGCDATLVSDAAKEAGYTITNSQANALACISQSEDDCGSGSVKNTICWNKDCGKGSASTAAGAYQVLLSTHSKCYDNSVCETAGGTSGTALNCGSAFSNGFEKTDATSQATIQKCLQAAGNTKCSAAAAACVVQGNSSMSDWASGADKSCVTKNLGS